MKLTYFYIEKKEYNPALKKDNYYRVGKKCETIEQARKEKIRLARYYGHSQTVYRIMWTDSQTVKEVK